MFQALPYEDNIVLWDVVWDFQSKESVALRQIGKCEKECSDSVR